MHPQESQIQQKIIPGWVWGGGVHSQQRPGLHRLPPTPNKAESRRILGVWCKLWSEAVNTHLPLHKPTQCETPNPKKATSMGHSRERQQGGVRIQ